MTNLTALSGPPSHFIKSRYSRPECCGDTWPLAAGRTRRRHADLQSYEKVCMYVVSVTNVDVANDTPGCHKVMRHDEEWQVLILRMTAQ